ncbi:MAG: HAD-IA family hydrolase [Bdellovibrionales bacterium]|nr:HAD-IA family hydrolase [Bdellovibrionales bacterium]
MIELHKVRHVFLDADDTLFRVRGSVGTAYARYFQLHGLDVSADQIDQVVPQAWRELESEYVNEAEEYQANRDRDVAIWSRFISNIFQQFSSKPVPAALLRELHGHFAKAESRVLTSFAVDFVELCKRLNLSTGILTNNDHRIHKLIPDLGIAHHFDHVFCASDLGYRKPSPNVFRGVEQRIGATPEEMLYVGDCDFADYQGALSAGWQAVWFNQGGRKTADNIRAEIRCFQELIEIFEQSLSS